MENNSIKRIPGHYEGIKKEWIVTNGIGGYASSTMILENTRKYHGLLVAATNPPACRKVLLASLDEELTIDGKQYQLATHRYNDVIHPEGFIHLKGSSFSPIPEFAYTLAEKAGLHGALPEHCGHQIPAQKP